MYSKYRFLLLLLLSHLCAQVAFADSNVYYNASTKNWNTVNIHYRIGTTAWTAVPGEPMSVACTVSNKRYVKKVFISPPANIEAVFNNGSTWENRGNIAGANYMIPASGTSIVNGDGTITTNAQDPCSGTPIDTTPDAFSFSSTANATAGETVISLPITVQGINTASSISVTNAEYSLDGGPYTSASSTILNGQKITLRTIAPSSGASKTATLVIGGVSGAWLVSSKSSTPSNVIIYYNSSVKNWSTVNIHYGIDAQAWTIAPGQPMDEGCVVNGKVYKKKALTVNSYATGVFNNGTNWDNKGNVGGQNYRFDIGTSIVNGDGTITTNAQDPCSGTPIDTTPDAFSFASVANTIAGETYTSAQINIQGINASAPISISGGEFSINQGAWQTTPSSIVNASVVQVRGVSSEVLNASKKVTLTIGGISADFVLTTTIAADTTPNAFNFTPVENAAINTLITSNVVTILGINKQSPVQVLNGEYMIGNSGIWTNALGGVSNGQTIQVRGRSSATVGGKVTVTLTVGGVPVNFAIMSGSLQDNEPDPFGFSAVYNANIGYAIMSNPVYIQGISQAVPISITNGEYSIGGGDFTSVAGSVSNGATIRLRTQASSALKTLVLTVGSRSVLWNVFGSPTPAQIVIYYNASTKNWSKVNLHYGYRYNSWTQPPGELMQDGCVSAGRTFKKKVSIDGTGIDGVFNNGVDWDNLFLEKNIDYHFYALGHHIVNGDGSFISDAPDPCTQSQVPIDKTPDDFNFTPVLNAVAGETYTSQPVVITGMNVSPSYRVTGGSLLPKSNLMDSPNPDTLRNGQAFSLVGIASSTIGATQKVTLSIGGVTKNFLITTTQGRDASPDPIWLNAVTNAKSENIVTSNAVQLSGTNVPITLTPSAGLEYAIDGGGFTDYPSSVSPGSRLVFRARAPKALNVPLVLKFTIGDRSVDWSITSTVDDIPDYITFPTLTNIAYSQEVFSAPVTVSGLDSIGTAIKITNGKYSLNGGNYTDLLGNIKNGDILKLSTISPPKPPATSSPLVSKEVIVQVGASTTQWGVMANHTYDEKPTAPSGLSAQSQTENSITVSWVAASDDVGIKHYELYRGTSLISTVANGLLVYKDTQLTPDTSYTYTITAVDTAGQSSPASTPLSVKTQPILCY